MLGSIRRVSEDSLFAIRGSLAATLTRIAFRPFFADVSGSLVAGRRLSPCPHLLASHGLSLSESRTPFSGAFSFFAGHFRARRRRGIYPPPTKIPRFFRDPPTTYPPPCASPCRTSESAVHKPVDNLIAQTAFRRARDVTILSDGHSHSDQPGHSRSGGRRGHPPARRRPSPALALGRSDFFPTRGMFRLPASSRATCPARMHRNSRPRQNRCANRS